jgi:hypothetical protein
MSNHNAGESGEIDFIDRRIKKFLARMAIEYPDGLDGVS